MAIARPRDPDSDDELLRAAGLGDPDALARIVRLHHEVMTRAALVVTLDLDAAAAAADATWPAVARELRAGRRPPRLEAWLCRLAVGEAVFLVANGGATPLPDDDRPAPSGDAALVETLAAMSAGDRALLALRHVVGLEPGDPGDRPRSSRWPLRGRAHLARLDAAIAATPVPDPAGSGASDPRARLLRLVDVPVWPVHADRSAQRAAAELQVERGRRISVAVSALVGFLVAAAPHLVPLLSGR